MAFYVSLSSKLERAVRALLILQGKAMDGAAFLANGDCFVSNDPRSRVALPNRTIVGVSTDMPRRHRPEGIVHLRIEHHSEAQEDQNDPNIEARRVAADMFLGNTLDTLGMGDQDNDDSLAVVAGAITCAGRWLATPDPNPPADPVIAAAEALIVKNNSDMLNFRVDWVRRARPFHNRGHDTSSVHWVEFFHFEAFVSYAAN